MAVFYRSIFPLRPFTINVNNRVLKIRPFTSVSIDVENTTDTLSVNCDGLKGVLPVKVAPISKNYRIETKIPDWYYFFGMILIIILFCFLQVKQISSLFFSVVVAIYVLSLCTMTILNRKSYFKLKVLK